MPKRISLYVLLMVIVGVLLSHFSLSQKENGLLLVVDGREVDAIGMAQEKWVRLTRNCERIHSVEPNALLYLEIQRNIQEYSPPSSETARIKSVLTSNDWSLTVVEFKDLLPAVLLLQHVDGKPRIVPNAIWSGETHPWLAAPFIRQYLKRKAPQAPAQLLECFDRP
jgi:hypothetical protein